ncbi:DUF4301 family protein [Salibacter sp.]|uniref:DUF4301 family protein n=1 Tax=Salibacter sp. TaxID=2010995 RepID=UPI0028703226|nr:DUF4301 family protein [Salibacter sp.]MDR9487154.1 DUF4301 family protein [Salibacter sp.]
MIEITEQFIKELNKYDMNIDEVEQQLVYFQKGTQKLDIQRPAVIADGILMIGDESANYYKSLYEEALETLKVGKFVPASGAASRMFKLLFNYLENEEVTPEIEKFAENFEKFAFSKPVEDYLQLHGIELKGSDRENLKTIVEVLLDNQGIGYGATPKALIDFHLYADEIRKAVDEQLAEAASYAVNDDGSCHIHFTISEAHETRFRTYLNAVIDKYEKRYGVRYRISWSFQHRNTDTIAVDKEFRPVKTNRGKLLFRPGGHGALLPNLQDLNDDIIFIKNIDNVQVESIQKRASEHKKILGGKLMELRKASHAYLRSLDEGVDVNLKSEIIDFAREQLNLDVSDNIDENELHKLLNRPLRVCGMVKNEGEPGGGPFWVKQNGKVSLQIVEKAQIDFTDPDQEKAVDQSTHFNPVDIVCSLKNYKGESFDLNDFIERDWSFVSEKSYNGQSILALEHPGLWNGSMAYWNTVFVQVPLETFSPVKTVLDLIKPAHQA